MIMSPRGRPGPASNFPASAGNSPTLEGGYLRSNSCLLPSPTNPLSDQEQVFESEIGITSGLLSLRTGFNTHWPLSLITRFRSISTLSPRSPNKAPGSQQTL